MVLAAAATGIMSLYASPAFADSSTTATASDSPGVVSGNNVQVPVNVPLNICGNTVDVVAALNPAFGNSCANGPVAQGRHAAPHHPAQHDAGSAHGTGRGAVHGGTDHARGHGGHPAGRGAEHIGNGGHAGQPAGGFGGERGGQSGLGGELGQLGDLGGFGGVLGGSGDSGHGDFRQGHSGFGDSGYGDVRQGHFGHMSPGHRDSGAHHGGWSGASSYGETHGSPGVLSGDQAAVPLDVPIEFCGNTLDVIGLLNPVFGNTCAYEHAPHSHPTTPPRTVPQPPKHHTPPVKVHEQPPVPPTVHRQYTPPALAETGSEGMLANGAISAALLVGGALLYRRSRAMSRP